MYINVEKANKVITQFIWNTLLKTYLGTLFMFKVVKSLSVVYYLFSIDCFENW